MSWRSRSADAAGSGSGSASGTVTATVTKTSVSKTSGAKGSSSSASSTASATPTSAVSTVKGRSYDAGTVVGVKHGGGLTILVLDRWTVKGLSDTKLAAKGVELSPHSDTRFFDQTKGKTYTVPVNPDATFVVNHCVDSGGHAPSMTSTPLSLKEFLDRPNRAKTVVVLAYDGSGRLTRLDTDPSC